MCPAKRTNADRIEAVPRVSRQRPAHDQLGVLPMIAPCGVVVVDAVLHGGIHHPERGVPVDPAVVAADHRQAHRAEAQRGELYSLKIPVNHRISF